MNVPEPMNGPFQPTGPDQAPASSSHRLAQLNRENGRLLAESADVLA